MTLNADGLQITLHGKEHAGAPLVWVPVFGDEGEKLFAAYDTLPDAPACTLAAVAVPDWNGMLSPWAAPRLYKRDSDFTGGADAFLARLTGSAIPAVTSALSAEPLYHALAGYSLAGLFALWAMFRTDRFRRAASASGSLWYPDIAEYAAAHSFARQPDAVSLSLGEKEANAKQPVLASVAEKTKQFAELLRQRGVPVQFAWEPGNHFQDADQRTARCIRGMLEMRAGDQGGRRK